MVRFWLLLMVWFAASCSEATKYKEFSTQVVYLGESYPVNCDVYSGYQAWGQIYDKPSTHCSVGVEGRWSRCAVSYDIPESEEINFNPVRANEELVDACGPTIERLKNADDSDGDGSYSPPS